MLNLSVKRIFIKKATVYFGYENVKKQHLRLEKCTCDWGCKGDPHE